MLRKSGLELWIAFIWLRVGTGGDSLEHDDEPPGSVKAGDFFQ
jgi:hypothetical protein